MDDRSWSDLVPRFGQLGLELVKVINEERGVSLLGRSEVFFSSEMEMNLAFLKPATTLGVDWGWLGDLGEAEHSDVELGRLLFAANRHRDLHMVKSNNGHTATMPVRAKDWPTPYRLLDGYRRRALVVAGIAQGGVARPPRRVHVG